MTISVNIILNMAFSVVICFGIPIIGMVIVSKKSKYMVGAFIAGCISFFVMQILIRIPLVQLVMMNADFKDTWLTKIAIAVILGLTAALFETAGRLASMKWLITDKRAGYYTAVAHGLGHGGIEAALFVGINYIIYIVIAIGLARVGTDAKLFSLFGATQQQVLIEMFTETNPILFLVGGLERGMVILFHVGMSVLMMTGIIKKQAGRYFLYVVGIHTILDTTTVILGYLGANYWLIEVFVGLFAVLSIFIVWSGEKTLEDHLETTDEAEEAVKEGY